MAPKPKKKSAPMTTIGADLDVVLKKKPAVPYVPKPTASNQSSYADAAFNAQLAALEKAKQNYMAQMNLQKDRLGVDYAQSERDLNNQKGKDLNNIQEDYAARGIIRSGVYGKRVDDYNTEYNNQLGNLARARDRRLQDLDVGLTNFNDEWGLNKSGIVDSAIQRRLAEIKSGKYTTTPPKKAPAKAVVKPKVPAPAKINIISGY